MRPRILLNLGIFATLGVILAIWAATTLLPFRIGETSYSVKAEFLSSPGLRKDLEVDYLGVRIGRVASVDLSPGKVVVGLEIDNGTVVPGNATAQVQRKSAVGEPYVELAPPPRPSAAKLGEGDVIPLDRTTVTVEYQRLFESAGDLLRAVPPADVHTLTHELATGLEGQGQNLRDTLADLDRLTGTLADNAGVLDALAVQLTQLTGTLSDKRQALAGGLNSLAEFTGTLSTSRNELNSILDRSPDFLENVNALLDSSKPGLRCLLGALGTPAPPVFDTKRTRDLHHAMDSLTHDFPRLADKILIKRPEGMYAKVKLVFTLAGPVPNAEEYARPLANPVVPPVYYCRGTPAAKKASRTEASAPERPGPSTVPGSEPFSTVEPRPVAAPSPWRADRWLPVLPVLGAVLVFAVTGVHTVRRIRSARSSR